MKNFLLISLLIFACVSASFAKGKPTEQTFLTLEQAWIDALIKNDLAYLDKLYADTLVYTHSSGSVDDKAKYIATLKSGSTKYLSIDRNDVKVNVYGDSAVVTCQAIIKLLSSGENRTVNARMIHVYAKVKNDWKLVAHQTTRLP